MYRNRKLNKLGKKDNINENKRLRAIDENTTIKIARNDLTQKKPDEDADGRDVDMFSQDTIPASQEPTQRYLSQRSSTLCRTQSRSQMHRPPNTYFELVLIKAGVNLDEADNFVLSCDHVSFVSKFREIFVKCQNYPENVETFKTGLGIALSGKPPAAAFPNSSKPSLALKLLSGCTISIPGEDSVYQSQDSMIVNFLMIEFLRDSVVAILLEKIDEYARTEVLSTSNNIPLLPLMLSQLRYVTLTHGDLIYSRITQIFATATDSAKWNIIAAAEVILDSGKHDDFTEMLLGSIPSSKELFHPTIIQTLTNFCLSTRMQGKLRQKILAFIKDDDQCPNATLPLLIKLLLKVLNEDNEPSIRELASCLREILSWKTSSANNEIEKQSQVDVFHFIYQGLTRSKTFFDVWLKIIQSLPSHLFRSVDFIILLGMINIKEERANYMENLIRRRIKMEHIKSDILVEAIAKFSPILELHTNTLMQIIHDFLKEKHKVVADFARNSYIVLFGIGDLTQKYILKKLVELTCDKSAHSMTNISLELLMALNRKYTKEVQNWGMILIPLLDRINEITLPQTRLVMELLCSIAYPAPTLSECPTLQDQIDMIVKKQIINRSPFVKKQGIIGSVQLIDNIARVGKPVDEMMHDLNESYNSVNDLPDGRGKIAANYIARVHSSTMYCAESLALFYDELASACSRGLSTRSSELDRPFIIYLTELMTYYFQNSFVAENLPDENLGIPLSQQRCINSKEDTNTEESELPPIAINIAGLVLKPPVEASSSVLVLAPLFNLMRVLHLARYEGSLELINALLGCAITLPEFFDSVNENFDFIFFKYNQHQCKQILDIYFHTVNWIRETVSSFSTQREAMIRTKVLIRLADLINIEETVRKLLAKAPSDYVPPICQFIANPTVVVVAKPVAGRGRKSAKNAEKTSRMNPNEIDATLMNESNANTTIADITHSTHLLGNKTKCSTSVKINFDNCYGPKEQYRQMDSDIMLILRETLNVKYPLPKEEVGKSIGLQEFRFIMSDIVGKIESITGVQKFNLASDPHQQQQRQYIANPVHFMTDLGTFLPQISANMEMIVSEISIGLEKVNRAYGNADLFTEKFNYLKVCLGLCLRLFAAFFSWEGCSDESTKDLLKESLIAAIGGSQLELCVNKQIPALAADAFEKCIKYETAVVDLKSAVHLYHLVLSLKKYSTDSSNGLVGDGESGIQSRDQEIRNLCKTLLCRKWFNYDGTVEKGAICNIYLDELIKGFLKNSDLRRQKEILKVVVEEAQLLGSKESSLRSFPNFKKANFPLLFRGLCEIFITSLSNTIALADSGSSDKLKVWEKSSELLNLLLEIVKSLDVPRNFQLLLKYSHLYLKLVIQHGLQAFEIYLRQNPERVNSLLKSLQVTTRFLHNLCCHSKALKNTTIVTQIPFLRETLENLVFRVKALLAANKCSSVFWMGNLKNKDLHGDEILSQSSLLNEAEAHNSEEDIPDDVSVDETVLDNDESSLVKENSSSASRSKCF